MLLSLNIGILLLCTCLWSGLVWSCLVLSGRIDRRIACGLFGSDEPRCATVCCAVVVTAILAAIPDLDTQLALASVFYLQVHLPQPHFPLPNRHVHHHCRRRWHSSTSMAAGRWRLTLP